MEQWRRDAKRLAIERVTMGGDDELVALFKRAAEIASAVPESMREAAFHRALDSLQQGSTPNGPSGRSSARKGSDRTREKATPGIDPVGALNELERSRAAEVDNEDGALGKSLALLRVAEQEVSIERLTAPQIATVLTEKFRWRVTRQSVTAALEKAGRLVDRRKDGRAVTYRLMQPGEDWLDSDTDARGSTGRSASSPARKSGSTKIKPAKRVPQKQATRSESAPNGRRSRTGPKAAVESLIESGYFASARTLSELQQKLQHDRALRFKPTDLSPALTRLLREARLSRAKNSDGQYEYVAPRA